jgi:hypothetical protein
MSIKIRAGVALIAIAVSFTGVVATTPPVHAQGLLDALFKSPAQRKREKEAREQARQEAAAARQVKPVRISGPSYRTYKPIHWSGRFRQDRRSGRDRRHR